MVNVIHLVWMRFNESEKSWMSDATGSLLIRWLKCMMDDDLRTRFIFVESLPISILIRDLVNLQNDWKPSEKGGVMSRKYGEGIQKYQNEDSVVSELGLFSKFRKYLHVESPDANNSECIFILNNVVNWHWNLVCVCNLKSITETRM